MDPDGARHPLTLQDLLVVAPYNAHVAALQAALPDGARVGTVDKFQGQEAPIVLYSMATSSAADAPRGMEFLYSLHRLNVATSRARCVAAIVASPALLTPDCRTPEQMRLANPFCRFLELARSCGRVGSLRGRNRLHRTSAAQTPGVDEPPGGLSGVRGHPSAPS